MPVQPLPPLDQLEPSLAEASHVLLMVDFDGTLVPIRKRPEECILPEEVRCTLASLATLPCCSVAIISGRELIDLEARVKLANVPYAGNHGLEIMIGHDLFIEPTASALREPINTIAHELIREVAAIPGAWVQHKQFTLSIHYRQAEKALHSQLIKLVEETTASHSTSGQFEVRHGKMVVEIRPAVAWNKGTSTQWLYQQLLLSGNTRVIYVGDDTTDEDAFAVWPEEITIHVGSSSGTKARYMVPDTAAVHAFLREVLNYLQHRVPS